MAGTGLLPAGFADLLPDAAEAEAAAISTLMDVFAGFGYARVKPPLAEYEESLFAPGPGEALREQSFRFLDTMSQKMLAVRFDITGQVSRIVSHALADEARPLRLMYANDVLRTKPSHQRMARQFTKIGCEFIGEDSLEGDLEACVVALSGLAALGVSGVTLDLCVPRLLEQIYDVYSVPADEREILTRYTDYRDMASLETHKGEAAAMILTLLASGGDATACLAALKNLPESLAGARDGVIDLYAALTGAIDALGLQGVVITIDPLERSGFEYHSGICFSLFSADISAEIGRGGRYEVMPGRESACGFTLYMDVMRGALAPRPAAKRIFVSYDQDWAVVKSLQDDGWVVVRGAAPYDDANCTHQYIDGKIKEI